jgi:hypothetical protein
MERRRGRSVPAGAKNRARRSSDRPGSARNKDRILGGGAFCYTDAPAGRSAIAAQGGGGTRRGQRNPPRRRKPDLCELRICLGRPVRGRPPPPAASARAVHPIAADKVK